MNPETLRERILRAVAPLAGEYATLTMDRIAGATGIAEAELHVVFPDKEAVFEALAAAMTAQLRAVLDPAAEVRRLGAIRVDQPLAARLHQVIDVLDAYSRRVRAGLAVFDPGAPTRPGRRDDLGDLGSQPEFQQAVATLLRPDSDHLRMPAETLAELFLAMTRTCVRAPNELQPIPAEQVVDLFLHGAQSP